jgi:hypothetical protein
MSDADGALVVALPEPVGRKARLGPFVTGREALKFAGFAAVGAVIADATTPVAWLPFLVVGLVVGAVRIDGKGPDAHVTDYLRYRWRRHPLRRAGPRRAPTDPEGAIARLPGGQCAAIVRAGGVPIGFLPRRDARGLFEGFSGLLRAQHHGLFLSVDADPVDPGPLLPRKRPHAPEAERPALAGYREMLHLLARQRRRRNVSVMTWCEPDDPEALVRLEERVQALTGSLIALGLSPDRLEGPALGAALDRLGFRGGAG